MNIWILFHQNYNIPKSFFLHLENNPFFTQKNTKKLEIKKKRKICVGKKLMEQDPDIRFISRIKKDLG